MRVLLFFMLFFLSHGTKAQIDATTDEVDVISDVVYKNGRPLTGTLYQDAPNAKNTCRCLLEATYLEGYLNGKKIEYHENGNLKYTGHFKNGTEYGEHTLFNKNGKVEARIFYANGNVVEGDEKDEAEQKLIEEILLIKKEKELERVEEVSLDSVEDSNETPENITDSELDETIEEAYWPEMADVPPMALGCEGLSGRFLANCTFDSIINFINVNLDKQALSRQGLAIGAHKVIIKFIISDKGVIRNIHIGTSSNQVEKEFIRVLKSLPTFRPGKINTQLVSVKYQFEMVLTLN
ncbi:hypothetical protein [Aequorivita marina]|uniref:hypothetical protein n=1 Tax=Aequorivita marina TaxID=3073654 RepID=UPI0028742C46|nr:hypothetical protein [Aequorivita sp. S2608]MDS1297140.1 hypothetical protein [Aequorivita sp. S2608]